ncbi:MAG TPA: UDP-N-acetylmuramoyl-L-alanine--D-glutamate ligase [Candidatus Limnocylindrales bacterium]
MSGSAIQLEHLTTDAIRAGTLRGRSVTVLGLARSGIALARFFVDAGARVTVYDGRPAGELTRAIESLGGRAVELRLGPDVEPASTWADADLIATSPSINPDFPTAEPKLRAALQAVVAAHRADPAGAPALVSETDLVLRMCPCPTIGVTGTKGKTTTSSLLAALLAADSAHPVVLGGNIGIPLVERLPELTPNHRVVIELSELQMPTLSCGTTVAVYTNVTADHLDRHGSLEAYRKVKHRLAELVDPAGVLVLNADDPIAAAYENGATVPVVTYRRGLPVAAGMGVEDGWIVADGVGRLARAGVVAGPEVAGPEVAAPVLASAAGPVVRCRIMPIAELAIPGAHNVSNAMAAIAVALMFGVAPDAIRVATAAFTGVEHRLEQVALVDGVRFINDSQGTQPDAVIAALRSFPRPLILIAGGRDKGVDLSGLGPVAAERADAAVLIGESGPALAAMFKADGLARVEEAATLESAVDRADEIARGLLADGGQAGPATVLLSPAAASFDMFVDYAARGRAFRTAAEAVAERRRVAGQV